MDDERVGTAVRHLRHRRNLRQQDLAAAAGVSQQAVSLLERGQLERLRLSSSRRIARALDVRLEVRARWRGAELDRLLDQEHAGLVERVARELGRLDWEVVIEETFNHFGERGSADLIGWHRASRALLVVEVKSRLVDVQALLGTFGRKVRVLPKAVGQTRGWRASVVGAVVVVPDTTHARRFVESHAATFAAAVPGRARDVRAWLREPRGAISAIWFLSPTKQRGATGSAGGRRRVRKCD
jgi:transcriptional regulator with XRE-family HTH domain